jgi:secretion/DNA translocation related TadE-like protein
MCQKIWFVSLSCDLGSGSILGFGIISAVLGIMTMSLAVSAQSLAIARLQTQTDNAALAAEDVLRGLAIGYPCETAEQIVQGFGGTLETCHIVSSDIYIGVRQQVMGIVHRVHARAAPGLSSTR